MTTLAIVFLMTTVFACGAWAWASGKSASLQDDLDAAEERNHVLRDELMRRNENG